MSKERELLKRVRDTLLELKETHYDLYWDIQTALDLREGLREGLREEPVAWHYIYDDGITVRERVTECMPLGEHYTITPLYTAPPKFEPLGLEIIDVCGSEDYREGFKDGALYAEKCHGIGGGE